MNAKRIPFPREHGAWAVLFGALILALAMSGVWSVPALLLALLFVLAFAVQAPLRDVAVRGRGIPLWDRRNRRSLLWIAAYGAPLLAGATVLVWVYGFHLLMPAAALGFLLTAADLLARRNHMHRSAAMRLAGIGGLTLVLPGVVCIIHPDRTAYAFVFWWLLVVYFASRLPVVRARIEARRGETPDRRPILLTQALLHVSVLGLAAAGLAPLWILLGTLPSTLLALRRPSGGSLIRAGWGEMALMVWYLFAVIGSYHIG